MAQRLTAIEDKRAMTLALEDMAVRINKVAANARSEDRTALAMARTGHDEAAYGLQRLASIASAIR